MLIAVGLEEHMEDAPVPFHRLLRHYIENRSETRPRFGVGKLKRFMATG